MKIGVKQLEDLKWQSAQTEVDLTTYTSSSNYFEVPQDGYVTVTSPINIQTVVRVVDITTYFAFSGIPGTTTSYFVPKGLKIFTHTMVSGGRASFRALKIS